jgi:3-hydroxymyristoyl/3-hydroxydecanoyl-(acyl carrier protein) dehydratase
MTLYRFTIPRDHPSLPGHFPDRPVVPGVVLLEEAIATLPDSLGRRVTCLREVKFLAPVAPGAEVTVEVTAHTGDSLSFVAKTGGSIAFRCRLRLGSRLLSAPGGGEEISPPPSRKVCIR